MEIATALLSASVQPLIERLISDELNIFARREKIHADIKDWEAMLAQINPLLDDAEDKQVANPAVKLWLDEFRDLTYDIEDVLDEFNTEALKRKVMEDSQAITDKMLNIIPTAFTSLAFKNKMASMIQKITKRLQRINEQQAQSLNLRKIANVTRSNQQKERPPTTSLVDESDIYGRNVDKEAILQLLLKNEEGGSNSIPVIAILGMGGIGKTTLAQLVYNDSAVEDFFDIRAWVCVSESFDVAILTRTILHKVSGDLKDLDLDSLQVTLKEKLSQKKFLLVLDDVWEEDYNLWDLLRRTFVSASSGSKIVVTTRKNKAAPITAGAYPYRVKELADDQCLRLLAHHALGPAQNFDARLDLKDIGQELVKRCNGLPLAAKVLGGLLRNKESRRDWERVLRNKLWHSSEKSDIVHPTLKLSYNDLPSHLKRCFVYCAIIPKDYVFDRDALISLWMAEGFLDHPRGGMLIEDLGIEYFEELVSRSFFQSFFQSARPLVILSGMHFIPTNSTRSVFVMHDLISDLAQTIAKDTCYNYEKKLEGDMSSSKYEKVRHASFSLRQDSQEYEVYSRMKNLRTIVGFPILGEYTKIDLNPNSLQENCYEFSPQSRCLRVLSLTVRGLPKSVGDLKHLRHLNLSFSPIEQLPESVSSLLNLHTLLLQSCVRLKKLPAKTRNLLNLRHLDIAKTDKLRNLPSGIGMLTNLQTLFKFIVDKGEGATIAELKNLNNLRGSLSIEGLENVQDGKSADLLKEKQGLEELVLKWKFQHGRNDMSVLEALEPHQNLKRLTISCYDGAEFPSWVSNIHLYSELVSLNLEYCVKTKLLAPKLPTSLRKLTIYGCKNLLSLPNGPMMPDDNENQPQSHLEHLEIKRCKQLTSLPSIDCLQSLQTLGMEHCENLRQPIAEWGLGMLSSLKTLRVHGRCPATVDVVSFPDDNCCWLPTSLKELDISDFINLESVSVGLQKLTSLQTLEISDCPKLRSLPREALPLSLQDLQIRGCHALESFSEMGFLSTSIQFLNIEDCPKLQSLPREALPPSLEELYIRGCHALESFSEMGFLNTSLQILTIKDCPKLQSLPREALPPSLGRLEISGCPLLKEHYSTGKIGLLYIFYED